MTSYRLSSVHTAVTRMLAISIAFLLSISFIGQIARYKFGHDYVFGLVPLFDVDGERNIPTFFTVMLALSSAALLALIGTGNERREKDNRFYWLALSLGFIFLAYDEAFQVHEQMTEPMRQLMGNSNLGFFYFGWVVPGIAVVCSLALFFLKFLLRLPATIRNRMIFSGCIYLSGCIGMELIAGKYVEMYGRGLTYSFLSTIEEGLEMAGLSVFITSLLSYVSQSLEDVDLLIASASPPFSELEADIR